jgi:hypothetical protein
MRKRQMLASALALVAFIALNVSAAQTKDEKAKDAQKKEVKKENPWVLKKDKEGIKVYVRNVEGIDFKEFMGVIVLDAPIELIDKIMNDVPNQVNWLCDTIESKVISADPVNPVQYNLITAPLVSNRDVVIQTKVVRTPGKIARYFQAITMASVPPRKGIVRMPRMVGMWLFETVGKNQTRVTYQNLADPGGSLPSGLVNMTVVKMPFVSLTGMRNQLKNPKFMKK